MEEPIGFVWEESRAVYHPAGRVTFDEAVALVRAAIGVACSGRAKDLLVDTRALTGFASPDTFQRFLAAVSWAEQAEGRLRLAMVARPEMIDPRKFGVTVAGNRGLISNIFTSDAEARHWLDKIGSP
jgi:hypothetical protein